MNSDHLKRVIALIQKTNDKVILMPEGQEPLVLMHLKQYEHTLTPVKQVLAGGVMFRVTSEDVDHLKNLSEEQMLEKVNREIGIWRDATASNQLPATNFQLSEIKNQKTGVNNNQESEVGSEELEAASAEDKFYIEPVEQG